MTTLILLTTRSAHPLTASLILARYRAFRKPGRRVPHPCVEAGIWLFRFGAMVGFDELDPTN
jgi:hypothetical protein